MFDPESFSSTSDETLEKEERVYRCASCDTEITKDVYLVCVNSDSPFQSFMNPNGFYFDVITFSDCESVIDIREPTFEHTWFPGYAWSLLGCAKCQQHLGWLFESVKQKPQKFYGLIRDRLSEG